MIIKKLQETLITGELAVRKWLGYRNNYMHKPTIPKLRKFISICEETMDKIGTVRDWAERQLNMLLEEQEYKRRHH